MRRLIPLLRTNTFWEAFEKIRVRRFVEPQLRNWFYGRLRVLQVVTSLHIGGAEKVCLELAKMPECIGTVTCYRPNRTELTKPTWDLSAYPLNRRIPLLLKLARRLHVDVVHTHLLTAEQNREIEKHFPLVTTIHNTSEAWPSGYLEDKPGLLVGCSNKVAHSLGSSARVAWNGIDMSVTSRPRVKNRKEIRLIAVANFRPQKRLERLPAILRELKKLGYKPKLTVVGETHATDKASKRSRDLFFRAAKRCRTERDIKIVQTLDVRRELAKSHVFISVSAHEGLSLSQLEALAAGLSVVATDVGGAEELQHEVADGAFAVLSAKATSRKTARAIESVWRYPRKSRLPAGFATAAMRRRYLWIYYSALARGPQSEEIWLITNNFSMGGAQTSAKRLLQKLQKSHPVHAFTIQEAHPTQGTLDLIAKGIPVRALDGSNNTEKAFALLRRAAGARPKAIFLWNALAPIKCLVADGIHTRVVDVSPGEMYFSSMDRYLKNPLSELPIRRSQEYGQLLAHAVVKYGREAEQMQRYLNNKVSVIPNGVEGINHHRRTFKGTRIYGTAARIAPHKRLEDLVDAFAHISAPLYIAGRVEPGEENYAAELRARSTPNIRWLGPQDIKSFLPTIDVFVMISEPAGCPNASLEAMANGLPIIATDVGGVNEQVIDGVNGWLVPPRQTEALIRAIRKIEKAPPSTLHVMARASLHHVKSFSMDKMVGRYLQIISNN